MGNSGLLQEWPDLVALLPEGGRDAEQSAAADCPLAGLNAMTDRALNHPLAQGTLSGVDGGLDSTGLQKGPKAIGQLQDLLSGAHRLSPRRSLAPLVAQLHPLLQPRLKGLADRPAAVSQGGPVDRSILDARCQWSNSCCCNSSSSALNSALASGRSAMAARSRIQCAQQSWRCWVGRWL